MRHDGTTGWTIGDVLIADERLGFTAVAYGSCPTGDEAITMGGKSTRSGIGLDPVYGRADPESGDYAERLGDPGVVGP